VLARRGYEAATLDEIAQEAGYTKGAVYSRFGGKEELLFQLLEEVLDEMMEETLAAYREGGTLLDRLKRGSDQWIARLNEDPDRFQLFVELWLHAGRDAKLKRRFAKHFRRLRDQMAELGHEATREAGITPPPGGVEIVSTLILALGDGLALVKFLDQKAVPDALLGNAVGVIMSAVFSNPDAARALSPEGLEAGR
jgi:AcrR family transcriptional regulator